MVAPPLQDTPFYDTGCTFSRYQCCIFLCLRKIISYCIMLLFIKLYDIVCDTVLCCIMLCYTVQTDTQCYAIVSNT